MNGSCRLLLLLLLTCLPAAAQNLIAHGSFELPATGAPTGWDATVSPGATATVVTTGAHGGNQALTLQTPADPADCYTRLATRDALRIEVGKRYRLQAWVRGAGHMSIGFYEYKPDGACIPGIRPDVSCSCLASAFGCEYY